jgi:tryptophan synthase alpha chain
MSRIQPTFESLSREHRKALVPYVTAGDPDAAATVPILHAMVEAGADVIELGVPFSDPMADGPVIQRASERALKNGVGLKHVLAMARQFRDRDDRTPVVLMGYANPIEAYGVERFAEDARKAGVDGAIVVDYPPEECAPFTDAMRKQGVDVIFLLAPTSSPERVAAVARLASGYIYYVSLKGITGATHLDLADVRKNIARIRKETKLPIGVGFGIRDGATARAICEFADAAVIGSRIVQEIESAPAGQSAKKVAAFLRSVRQAMDEGLAVKS